MGAMKVHWGRGRDVGWEDAHGTQYGDGYGSGGRDDDNGEGPHNQYADSAGCDTGAAWKGDGTWEDYPMPGERP